MLSVVVSGVAAAGALVTTLVAPAIASDAPSQLRREDVRYQEGPKGSQRCSGCKNFVGPNACRVVAGLVNPNGWCLLFQAKAA